MIPKAVKSFLDLRTTNMNQLTCYPPADLKKLHGRMGKAALKQIAQNLGLKEFKVNYNPSGIINAGYVSLIGMFDETRGVYISVSSSGIFNDGKNILYRSVKHMKDYTGGMNHYLSEEEVLSNYSNSLRAIGGCAS
jgi:hypothetical protein